MVKEYLLNETQGKVYASVVFVLLLHSLSAVHYDYDYDYDIQHNISAQHQLR